MVIKHDVIINFGRKLMIKISFVQHANYWRMLPRYLGYRRLCSYLYVYSSIANIVAALQQMYEKSFFFCGWVKSTQKFVVEFMLLRHRVIRLPHIPLNP